MLSDEERIFETSECTRIINHDNAHKRRLIVKSEISETLKFYSVTTRISKSIRMSGLIMYVEEIFKI